MTQPTWITDDVVRAVHLRLLTEHDGPPGIRDPGPLAPAWARPRQIWSSEPQSTIARLAGAHAYGILRNHPFADGNQRVALVLALLFLDLNGYVLEARQEDRYTAIMALASGGHTEADLTSWLDRHARASG